MMEQTQLLQLKQLVGEIEVGIEKIDERFNEFDNIKQEYSQIKSKFNNIKNILKINIVTPEKSDTSGGKSL